MSERYDRQIKTPYFGQTGQNQLRNTTIMVIGGGALGSTVSEMLARSGVGHLVICDMDVVSISNLHRQSLFDERDSKNFVLKVDALKSHIARINSDVSITTIPYEIGVDNIESLIKDYNPLLLIDGTDNFATRYILNDACNKHQLPWIYGACLGVSGTVYGIEDNPCLRCILPDEPNTGQDCAIAGIMPQTAHMVASIQVSEVMHYISHGHFSGKLTTIDCDKMIFKSKNIDGLSNSNCPTCAQHLYPALNEPVTTVTKMCRGKYQTRVSSTVFENIHQYILHQNEHFKLLSFNDHKIHLLKNGRIIVFDVYSTEEATAIINHLIKTTT